MYDRNEIIPNSGDNDSALMETLLVVNLQLSTLEALSAPTAARTVSAQHLRGRFPPRPAPSL